MVGWLRSDRSGDRRLGHGHGRRVSSATWTHVPLHARLASYCPAAHVTLHWRSTPLALCSALLSPLELELPHGARCAAARASILSCTSTDVDGTARPRPGSTVHHVVRCLAPFLSLSSYCRCRRLAARSPGPGNHAARPCPSWNPGTKQEACVPRSDRARRPGKFQIHPCDRSSLGERQPGLDCSRCRRVIDCDMRIASGGLHVLSYRGVISE